MSKVYDQYRVNEDGDSWYLKISDGSVYGPETYAVMSRWVAEGRVAPEDEVSQDGESWMPASSVGRFKMEWVAEFSDGSTYGPFNLLAVPNLLKTATFGPTTKLVNRVSGKSLRVDQVVKPGGQADTAGAAAVTTPVARPIAAATAEPVETEQKGTAPASNEKPVQRDLKPGETADLSGPDFRKAVGALEINVKELETEKVKLQQAATSFDRERHEWERKFRVLESQNEKLTKKVSEKEEQYESQAKWLIELREKGEKKIKDLQESLDREKGLRATLSEKQGGDVASKIDTLTKQIDSLAQKLSDSEEKLGQERESGAQVKQQWAAAEREFRDKVRQLTSEVEAAKSRGAQSSGAANASVAPPTEQLAELAAARKHTEDLEAELVAKTDLMKRFEHELDRSRGVRQKAWKKTQVPPGEWGVEERDPFKQLEGLTRLLTAVTRQADAPVPEAATEQTAELEARIASLNENLAVANRKYDEVCKRADEAERAMHAFAENQKASIKEAVDEAVKTQELQQADLKAELARREVAVQAAEKQLASVTAELEQLRISVAEATSRCEAHQELLKNREQESTGKGHEHSRALAEANAKLASLEQEIVDRNQAVERANADRDSQLRRIAEFETIISRIQSESQAALDEAKSVITTERASREALALRSEELQQALKQAKDTVKLLNERGQAADSALATAQAAQSQLTTQLTESRAREEKLASSLAGMESRMADQAAKFEGAIKDAEDRQNAVDQAQAHVESMLAERNQALADSKQVRAELSNASKQIEALQSECAAKALEVEAFRISLQQADAQREQQIRGLEAALLDRDANLARLSAEIASERNWRAGVEASQAKTEASFRAEIESLQTELKSQLAEQKSATHALAESRQRLGQMEKQLSEQSASWEQHIDNLRTDVALHEGRVKDLTAELSMGQSLLTEVRRDKDEREKSLLHRIQELEDRERTSTAFLENATGEIRRIRSRCDSMETDLQTLREHAEHRKLQQLSVPVSPLPVVVFPEIKRVEPILVPDLVIPVLSTSDSPLVPIGAEDVKATEVSVKEPDIQVQAPGKVDSEEPKALESVKQEALPVELMTPVVAQPVEAPLEIPTPSVGEVVDKKVEVALDPASISAPELTDSAVAQTDSIPDAPVSTPEKKKVVAAPAVESTPSTIMTSEPVSVTESEPAKTINPEPTWFLKLEDESIYGPVPETELKEWARQCRIAPTHEISQDQTVWKLAGALSQLEMDWLVITPSGEQLGPFHRAAIADLVAEGGIDLASKVRHRDGGQEILVESFCLEVNPKPSQE